MDVLAAYREVGSYRGAAEICGTTHKTVRRIVERHDAGGAAPQRKDRATTTTRSAALVAERVRSVARADLGQAAAAGGAGRRV